MDNGLPAFRRAPGQRGGYEWRGPRRRIALRLGLDLAAEAQARARAEETTLNDYIASALRDRITSA
jgi:predicted HicB family RNase H-like nuclease